MPSQSGALHRFHSLHNTSQDRAIKRSWKTCTPTTPLVLKATYHATPLNHEWLAQGKSGAVYMKRLCRGIARC